MAKQVMNIFNTLSLFTKSKILYFLLMAKGPFYSAYKNLLLFNADSIWTVISSVLSKQGQHVVNVLCFLYCISGRDINFFVLHQKTPIRCKGNISEKYLSTEGLQK